MDVFATVLAIVIAGIALFVGYRVGIKDGFRGGVQTGRSMERRQAEEQRRFLTARLVQAQAELHAHAALHGLPPGQPSPELSRAETGWPQGSPRLIEGAAAHTVASVE